MKMKKRLAIALINIVLSLLFAAIFIEIGKVAEARPVPPDPSIKWVRNHWEVTPTGSYPEDRDNVQWAVDQGGKVVLKSGTFNFGEYITQLVKVVPSLPPFVEVVQDPGRVEVGRDGQSVVIAGETNRRGKLLTKIWGGRWTIYSMNFVKMSVKNIEFEDSGGSAIVAGKSTGIEISGCKITKLRYERLYAPLFFLKRAVPITILPVTPDFQFGPPEDITGHVVVKNNYIRGFEPYEPYDADIQMGVILQNIDATANIRDNKIYNCAYSGLAVRRNKGTTVISDNVIHPGYLPTSFLPKLGWRIGDGITILAGGGAQGSVLAKSNQIHCISPLADGISVGDEGFSEDASLVFSDNRVFIENSTNGGLSCYPGVHNSFWKENRIRGRAKFGIRCEGADDNVFRENDMEDLEVAQAHLYLDADTHNNVFVENEPEPDDMVIIDEGQNNRFLDEDDDGEDDDDDDDDDDDEDAAPAFVPDGFALGQNLPNPFNPDTWIPYRLAENVDVTIRIHDVAGKPVRTLDLGHRPAGLYASKEKAAYWDGRNEAGEHVASGLYFYSIQAGEFAASRKMLLVK
jgi:hypothetical protein